MIDADAVASEVEGDFFSLGAVQHSPDHKWLAYTVDRNGSETYEIFLRDIDTGVARTTAITTCAGGVQWAADSQTLFWVERDENQRPYAVFAKDVHDASASPRLIYKETDPGFFVSVGESESGRYIEISAHNHITSEVHRLRADTPSSNPACVSPREENREYSLHETGDDVYILTNTGGATDFKIMKAKDAAAEVVAVSSTRLPLTNRLTALALSAVMNLTRRGCASPIAPRPRRARFSTITWTSAKECC